MEISGYRVGESLSHTARHAVHRARHVASGRDVVLKRAARDYPLAEDVLRLELERSLLERLRGPGIVELVGVEQLAGSPVLVLEDFAARSLGDTPLPLDLEQFFRVAPRIVAALARVHAAQVIHKDIKPSNVLWNAETDTLKLIDFQLSAVVSRERRELKVGGQLEGSLPYLSPEQTGRMNRSLDYRSDYYSLGVTFFELLTGQLPFQAADAMGWVHCHLSKRPPLVTELNPAVPRSLALLIAKLLSKEPSERYQGSVGLLADLTRCHTAISAGGADEPLVLGSDDISERLSVSQRLVGRERELQTLLSAFARARSGRARLLLVSGAAGVGKSSVIREALAPIAAWGGWSGTGKFDQLERGVPYAALAGAFRDLLRQVLAESEPRVEACRQRVLELVGRGLSQLVEFLPELSQLVGPQPPSEKVEGPYAQRRFQQAFARLARALATAEAPLALFLDDLQWTDPSTPDLLVELLCHGDLQHLLVIGAFRDNEVDDNHLLALAIRELREVAPELVDELQLAPLTAPALTELVSDTLRASPERCAALAAVLFEKSQGNPFFAAELLETLHKQGAIRFDAERGQWSWDLDAVRAASATANVVELMVQRLRTLSDATRAVLKIAACLGNTFSVSAIAELLGQDAPSVARALSEPAREGLILPLTSNVRFLELAGELAAQQGWDARFGFQHDRVQEAAYSLTSPEERALIHLRIGRTSLARAEHGPAEDRFASTNHLNLGRSLITDLSEREQLARLNHEAAAKAFATTSFALAARYHDAAAACLAPEEWAERPEFRFRLFSERVSSVLLAGERQRAEQLCSELFAWAPSKAERGRVFLARCEVLVYQADLPAAVEAVRQGLELLGFAFPAEPAAIQAAIGQGIGKMQAHLARVPVERLHELPDVANLEVAVALELLYTVVPAAIMIYPPLFVLAELLMFDAALTHGLSPFSAKNFVDCGMIQGQFLGDFDRAYGLGKAAFRVLERYGTRALASPVHFVFAAFVSSWRAPHAESLASCRLGMKLAAESGNLLYLGYFNVLHPRMLLLMGRPLAECQAEGQTALSFVDRTRGSMQLLGVRLCTRALTRLSDPTLTRQASELADAALEEEIRASGNQQWVYQYGQVQMLASVLLGDWPRAEYWSAFTRESLLSATTNQTVPEYHLLECLLDAHARWPRAGESERPALLADCQARAAQLRGWAQGCPENHAQLSALAEAALGAVSGEAMDRVLGHYEHAAVEGGLVYLCALARELQSAYLREKGFASLADAPLERAYELYAHWGAGAKLALLEAAHPRLFATAAPASWRSTLSVASRPPRAELRGHLRPSALDSSSVLEAVHAISSEVKPERLYARLMAAMLENAAAQRGCLLLVEEASERLVLRARAEAEAATVLEATALDEQPALCAGAVRAVARSREVLVLDDAQSDPRFARDRHVRAQGVKSVLCVPVLHQSRVTGVLYLENNATTHAFTAARVEALRVIAGQAAISIANAELYAHLERRVQERTRELAAKTRKLEAILDGLQQGVFTLDSELRVQSEYSVHLAQLLGTEAIVGRPLGELLFAGARLGADELERNAGALLFAFGSRRLLADANARHLIREFTRAHPDGSEQLLEVDWNWIVGEDDCVASVLVTLRDVTLVRGLARQVARAEREARIVAQILSAGPSEFSAFCAAARRWLNRNRERLSDPTLLPAAELPGLFRNVHTIKGSARALGFTELADAAHAAEDGLARLKQRDDGPARSAALSASNRLAELLDDHERTGREKLAPLWSQHESGLRQAMAAVETALSRTVDGTLQPLQLVSELEQIVQRQHVIPLEQLLERTCRSLPSLAQELGRPPPELDFQARGWTLADDWAAPLEHALTHAFRNALDHGIEPVEQRLLAGKQPRGRLQLRVEPGELSVQLRLSDDGRGLPLEQLRARAARPLLSDAELAEAVFAFGVSSAAEVSSISGRGVGLDALRSELRQRGADAFIEFTGSARDGYRPFQLVLRLPISALSALRR